MSYLSSMFKDMNDPLSESGSDPSTEEANRRFAAQLGISNTSCKSSTGPNTEALPNPWAPPPPSSSSSLPPCKFIIKCSKIDVIVFPNSLLGSSSVPSNLFPNLPPLSEAEKQFGSSMSSSIPFPNLQNLNSNDFPQLMNQFMQMQPGFSVHPSLWNTNSSVDPSPNSRMSFLSSNANPSLNSSTEEPPEERFASQIQSLHEMGFTDKDKCIRALLSAGGNVEAAIAFMLDHP